MTSTTDAGSSAEGARTGTLQAEAALLLDAVAARLTTVAGPPEEDAAADARCPSCGHAAAAPCTACPVCRFVAILRGERPEVTARLVDGALGVVRALRAMLPDADGTTEAQQPDDAPTRADGDVPPPPPRLQRIEIR